LDDYEPFAVSSGPGNGRSLGEMPEAKGYTAGVATAMHNQEQKPDPAQIAGVLGA